MILLILGLFVSFDSRSNVVHAAAAHRGRRAAVGAHDYPSLRARPLWIVPGVLRPLLRPDLAWLHTHVVGAEREAHGRSHLHAISFSNVVGRLTVQASPFALERVPGPNWSRPVTSGRRPLVRILRGVAPASVAGRC